MILPRFSAWSGYIMGGLHGWGDGGHGPPGAGPPDGVGAGPPPGAGPPGQRPPVEPSFNMSGHGPLFSIPHGPPPEVQSAWMNNDVATTNIKTTPLASAIATPLADYTVNPTSSGRGPSCTLVDSPLTNEEQVGDAMWGTLCQQPFNAWLDRPDGTKYTDPPWGNLTTHDTDPTIQGDVPNTNVTRYYDWTISRTQISPDGVLRDALLVNNQFPGPLIEANYGDWIEVKVYNNISLPEEGTSMHWHGIIQRQSPWSDGSPGVAQCPIAPGASHTYRFRADVYGTTIWHAHYSAQYTAGAAGPIVIHGPSVRGYDADIGPIMLSDWNHIPYFSMVANIVGTDFSKQPPLSDNGLINGRGRFNCSTPSYSNSTDWLGSYFDSNLTWTCVEGAQRSKFRFQSGKTHRLRLINQGADGVQKFSIDSHQMTVIATDFVPTQPYDTDVVTLGVGQRTDVLVTANQDPKTAVWMRTQLPGGPICGGLGPYGAPVPGFGQPEPPGTVYPDVMAAIYYEDADTTVEPTSVTDLEPIDCGNDDLTLTLPDFSIQPGEDPYVLNLAMTLALNETGNFEWQMNGQAYRANFNQPILYDAAAGQTSFPDNPEWNVYNVGANASVVLNVTNLTPFTHPMHLHGHTFFVLSEGEQGTVWDGSTVNPVNPMRRDVQIIQSGGYAALQFEGDNPGVWPFHCHVAWHLSSGLAVNIISQPDDINGDGIPEGMEASTCDAWNRYSSSTVVDQIDSGS